MAAAAMLKITGLLVSRSLFSDSDEYPAIQLMNISGKQQFLSAGLSLGLAEAAKSADTFHSLEHSVCGADCDRPSVYMHAHTPPADLSNAAACDESPRCVGEFGSDFSAAAGVNGLDVSDSLARVEADCISCVDTIAKTVDDDGGTHDTGPDRGNSSHIECMFDTLPSNLTGDERARVIALLKNNVYIFATDSYDIGRTTLNEAEINTGHHAPLAEPLRRRAKAHLEVIDKTISDLKSAGLISDSVSPWASNLVVIKRPDGPPHVTVDLHRLNSITSRQTFVMPNVADSLDFLSQSRYLSVLDCTQSYFHIPLKASDREKTALQRSPRPSSWWGGGPLPPPKEPLTRSRPSASNFGPLGLKSAPPKINSWLRLRSEPPQFRYRVTPLPLSCHSPEPTLTHRGRTLDWGRHQNALMLYLILVGYIQKLGTLHCRPQFQ